MGPSIHFFEKILMIPANKETFNEIGGQSRDIIIDLQSFFSNKIVPKTSPNQKLECPRIRKKIIGLFSEASN